MKELREIGGSRLMQKGGEVIKEKKVVGARWLLQGRNSGEKENNNRSQGG